MHTNKQVIKALSSKYNTVDPLATPRVHRTTVHEISDLTSGQSFDGLQLPEPKQADLDGHVLVCEPGSAGIHNFVRPLREDLRWERVPIVFFGRDVLDPSAVRRLYAEDLAENVFFLHGNPNNTTDFSLARVDRAVRVVMLVKCHLHLTSWLHNNHPNVFVGAPPTRFAHDTRCCSLTIGPAPWRNISNGDCRRVVDQVSR